MKRYAIIGSPIGHSLSPAMQQAAFKAAGIDAVYEALAVETPQLDDALVRLSSQYDGWNVTTPLKETMAARADALTVEARDANAANVVRREDDGRLTAHNTDGDGCVRAIVESWSWQPGGGALVLGSGPAARAIALALRAAGEEAVQCWSRSAERAAQIGPPPDRSCALLISALPSEAVVPDELAAYVSADTDVFDVNYRAARSPVAGLRARRRSDGLPMLLHQGALSFTWWTELPAPLAAMREALSLNR